MITDIGNRLKVWDFLSRKFGDLAPNHGPFIDLPNCGRDDLAQWFAELGFTYGVEIGTERGIFAETLCKVNPHLKLYCVDPYKAYRGYREHKSQKKIDGFMKEARVRLSPYWVTFIREFSTDASKQFADETLDFVYIDGNHSLLHVVQDLWYWVPKVKKGGIVAGHDYIKRIDPSYAMHVVEAVNAYCEAFRIQPLFILGSKAIIPGEVRDKPRSFMFVKE